MGTDATDLVITNGFRVWQRSIPIGGSHFTKALTRELKLTFAKAEHLKRNATAAADPKAVFQAMKPTFSDLLTELQRSIGYFSNLDRAAKIGRVVALGNAMKLPGPAPLSVAESGLRHREDRVVPRPGGRAGRHLAHLPGKPAVVRRELRAGVAGLGKGGGPHQPAAEGNRSEPADQAQEALGGGRRGAGAARLRHQLCRPFLGAGRRERSRLAARANARRAT